MSRKKWSDEDIEETLTHMPKIEDKQSKDEIFQAVREGMAQEEPKKKKQWFFPMAVTAAAALLLLIMVPSLMNTGLFTSDTQTGSEMNVQDNAGVPVNSENEEEADQAMNNNMNSAENEANENNNEEADANQTNEALLNDNNNNNAADNTVNNAADNNSNHNNNNSPNNVDNMDDSSENNDPDTVEYAVTEEDAAYVTASVNEDEQVVLTPHEQNGASLEEVLLLSMQESDPTVDGVFSTQLEEVRIDEPEEGHAVLQFEEDTMLESLSSAEFTHTESVIQEIFSYHRITEVHFQAGEEETSFGQSGESSLSISTLNRGYYQDDSGDYVSAREAGEPTTNGTGDPLSFEETVEEMKEAENGFDSALPDSIEVEETFTENGTGVVQFTSEDTSQEEIDQFTQAIQLTAGSFDLNMVELIDDTNEEIIRAPVTGNAEEE